MAKFRSYASPSGFKPLEAPDQSRKILQQGQQQVQAMQRAMQFDLDNRDRYATALQNAQRMEMANRDMVFKQDQQNRAVVQEQVQRNYQQTINDAQIKGQQELKNLQALSAFSDTAFKALGEFNQKREEGIKLGVQKSLYALGLDTKTLMEIHKLDRNFTDQDLAENQFIKDLLNKGTGSIQDIRFLMKNSNAKYWSESRYLAENLGVGYGNYVNDNYETKFNVGDQQLSYAEARATNNLEAQQSILSRLRDNYTRESGALNLSPQIAATYVHPQMRAFENQLQQAAYAEYRKGVDNEVDNNIIRAIDNTIKTGGAAAANRDIASTPAGTQRTARKQAYLDYYGRQAAGDNWKSGLKSWQDMLNQPVDLPDGTQTTFGEFNRNDPNVIAITRAFVDARRRSIQDFNLQETETRTEFELASRELAQMLKDNPNGFTEADAEAAQLRLQELFKGRVAPGTRSDIIDNLIKNESTNALYRKKLDEQLQKLADTGQLTKERMEIMGVPGTIAAKWMGIAEATSKDRAANGNFKPQMDALAALAKSPPTIQAKPDGTYHWTVPLMTQQLQNRFLTKYSELKAAGDPNAVNAALSFVQQEFAAQAKNPQFFSQDSTNLGGYAAFTRAAKPSGASVARMQWVQSSISRLGVKALDSNGSIYTVSELNEIEKDMQKPGFKMDPMAEYVGRQMGVDPFTVINRQRVASDMPPLQLPSAVVSFSTTVNPQLKRMLDAYRTPQLSTRAMVSTNTFNASLIPKGMGQMVVTAAQTAGVAPSYIAALAEIESTWDPNATSPTGAIGLMQIQQRWHPSYTGGKDPQANLTYGAQYYNQLLRKYGDPVRAAGAYNAGPGRFDEFLNSGKPLPQETVNHMRKFSQALAKYGDVSQLQSRHTMRTSMQSYGRGSFERPSSVVFETSSGQPGVDLYFESKRFPAVLGGVVKDVSRESGYGNYVVVESTDPMTGQKVDVLYGHLADGLGIRPGQRVEAGDIIGTQGGTGNVRSVDGTIASIDFLAPAPKGSKSMAPYVGFDNLRRYVVQQLQR